MQLFAAADLEVEWHIEQTWDPVGEAEVPGSKWNFTHTQNKGGRRWLGLEEWDFGSVPEPEQEPWSP